MGRTHLDGVQHPIPTLAGSLEGGLDLQRIAIAAEQAVDLVRARGLAQIKEDLDLLARVDDEWRHEGGAGVEGRLDHRGHRFLVGDIDFDGKRGAAAGFEVAHRILRFLPVARGDDDRGAGGGEPARHAEPDAAVAAGHDRDFSAQIEHALS